MFSLVRYTVLTLLAHAQKDGSRTKETNEPCILLLASVLVLMDRQSVVGKVHSFPGWMEHTHGKEPEHLIPKARLQNICPHRFVLSSHGATTTYPAATQPTNRCIICHNLANKEGHA